VAVKSYLANFDNFGVTVNGRDVPQRTRAQFQEWLAARPGRQEVFERARAEALRSLEQQKARDTQAALEKARAKKSVSDITWSGDSTCFASLHYSKNARGVFADFIGPTAGEWFFPMSRSDAKAFFDSDSVGSYFNDEIR
jgi:hypothetical protein